MVLNHTDGTNVNDNLKMDKLFNEIYNINK